MDIETPVDTKQEQLPQIRRVTRLNEIPRVIPPRPIPKEVKRITPPQRPRYFITFLITLIFFEIVILLIGVNRYNKLYKLHEHLYQISKDRISVLQYKIQDANIIKNKLSASRRWLINNYLDFDSKYKILQFKIDNYKDISKLLSLAKTSKINILEGDLRVAYARISAAIAQNELLTKKLAERDESINEVTSRLIKNIGEQEALVNENLRLKEKSERLSNELQTIKRNMGVIPLEDKNADK